MKKILCAFIIAILAVSIVGCSSSDSKTEAKKKGPQTDGKVETLEEPVARKGQKVKNGDTAIINFEGYLGNKKFEGGADTDYSLIIGSNSFIEGFEDQVIGMKLGDEKIIKVTFPKEYQSTKLAGKEAKFIVGIRDIISKESRSTYLVEEQDTAIIDYSGKVNGVAFEGGTAQKYPLVIGSGSFIPGFEEQLLAMKEGETKDIKVTFPTNYSSKELAGKEAVFTVKVNYIIKPSPEE